MSLQVWLPLNGKIDNYGLLNIQGTQQGTITWNTDGKIGKCLSAGDGTQIVNGISYNSNLIDELGEEYSCAIWVKPLGNHVHYNGTFISSGNWNTTCWSFGVDQTNAKVDVFGKGYNHYIDCSVPVNTWTHLVCTQKNGVAKLYKNGVYVGQKTGETVGLGSDTNSFCVGRETYASGYFSFNGLINDVRIYNHCLSEKEIKEISNCLILHYPLKGLIGNSNNLGNTSADFHNLTNGYSTSCSGWGGDAGTVSFYHSGGYNNYPYKVYHKTATGTGGIYYKTANDINIVAGKTYTMSIYIKASRSFTDSAYNFNINRGSDNYYINFGKNITWTTDWQKLEKTFTATADQAGLYGEMSIIYDDSVTDYYCYFSGFKIEEGSESTQWTPPINNTNIEYDISGYNNNGIIFGNLSTNTKSERYLACSNFYDDATSIQIPNLSTLVPSGIFTFNIWFKKVTGEWSSKGYETILGGPSGFELEGKPSSSNVAKIRLYSWGGSDGSKDFEYPLDKFNMLTMVRTTSGTTFYLNGEQVQTGSAGSIPSGNYFLGAWSTATGQNYKGYMSDARIYSTALSAENIKELYQTTQSIDKNGNIYAYEFIED